MDKNTMVFLLIAFLVIMVVAFFLWKYYRDSQPVHETNKYDRGIAWANAAKDFIPATTQNAADAMKSYFSFGLL